MEIFGIGLPEIMLIGIVAMIVLGPDRLPEAARTLGKAVADFRRAIEPARSAWADVSREITSTLEMPAAGSTAGNPWHEHPVADGLTAEEKENFFRTGEIPAWKRTELDKIDVEQRNGGNGTVGLSEDLGGVGDLDYPMPHATMIYQPAPPFTEELAYPEPRTATEPEEVE